MQLLRRYSMVGAIAATAVLVAGCGNNKVAECNQLIDSINKGHTLVTNFQGKDAAAATKLAGDIDGAIAELEKIKLSDKKLIEFQSGFSQIYQDLGKQFRTTAKALNTVNAAEATPDSAEEEQKQKAKAQVEAAGIAAEQIAQKADRLASEINSYCGATSQ